MSTELVVNDQDRTVLLGHKVQTKARVIYYGESLEDVQHCPCVYLDGPKSTPVGAKMSWRKRLIETFLSKGFTHAIIVPECRDSNYRPPYDTDEFFAWEDFVMKMATIVMFWIPRDSKIFPGRNINDRWGMYKNKQNVIVGMPKEAQDISYQTWYAKANNIPVVHHLENMTQYVKEQLDQFNNLEFEVNNGTLFAPPSEQVLNNTLFGKMIDNMGRRFVEEVDTIYVPVNNSDAINLIRRLTCYVYRLHKIDQGCVVLTRAETWEKQWRAPPSIFAKNEEPTNQLAVVSSNDDDIPNLIENKLLTVSDADRQRLEELQELKKRLGLLDTNNLVA
jgi:hypothetical protein